MNDTPVPDRPSYGLTPCTHCMELTAGELMAGAEQGQAQIGCRSGLYTRASGEQNLLNEPERSITGVQPFGYPPVLA